MPAGSQHKPQLLAPPAFIQQRRVVRSLTGVQVHPAPQGPAPVLVPHMVCVVAHMPGIVSSGPQHQQEAVRPLTTPAQGREEIRESAQVLCGCGDAAPYLFAQHKRSIAAEAGQQFQTVVVPSLGWKLDSRGVKNSGLRNWLPPGCAAVCGYCGPGSTVWDFLCSHAAARRAGVLTAPPAPP